MFISVLGFNHKKTPINVRERLAFDKNASIELSKELIASDVISEAFILSTCNRTEIYAVGSCPEGIKGLIRTAISNTSKIEAEELDHFAYFYFQQECLEHLFKVASSLDAMVVGESQILGQLKDAYQTAVGAETVGPYLHKACHSAFRAAKRVRTETNIALHPISIGSLATELAEQEIADLKAADILIIGAGETSGLVASHFKDKGVSHIWIANRTAGSAELLAKNVGGTVVSYDSWQAHLQTADIVVTSIGGGLLINKQHLEKAMSYRNGRPLIMIDLAVPRNIETPVDTLNVKTFNIDDLEALAGRNLSLRKDEATKGGLIALEESALAFKELMTMRIAPALELLRDKCSFIMDAEVLKLFKENPGLTSDEQASIKRCVETVVKKIIHEPVKLAKEEMIRPENINRDSEILNILIKN